MSRIYVDPDLCEGSRLCVGIHPTLFDMDGAWAVVRADAPLADLDEAELDEIIYLCPASAIRRSGQ